MDTGKSYSHSLKSINEEIKRLNQRLASLRIEKMNTERRFKKWQRMNGLDEYDGYKREKLCKNDDRPKMARLKKQEKVDVAVRLFREVGVPDPEGLYNELVEVQKPRPIEN